MQVVIATYRRPDALRVAIESVVLQDHDRWKLLVVGDACASETGCVVASFRDDRIAYVNLPERCGEQAIPNSVGLGLAGEEYAAFLNHDDVWMPDHLSTALAALARDERDFFIARCAVAHPDPGGGTGAARPVFREKRRPPGDDVFAAYDAGPAAYEPCSGWVVGAPLARRVGFWRPARALHRTPLEDWLLRALRCRARVAFGERVTVLKLNTQHDGGGTPRYEARSEEHAWISGLLREPQAGSLRELVEADLRRGPGVRPPTRRRGGLERLVLGAVGREVFRRRGIDLYALACRLARRPPGQTLEALSHQRTGEPLPRPPSLEALLAWARRELERPDGAAAPAP